MSEKEIENEIEVLQGKLKNIKAQKEKLLVYKDRLDAVLFAFSVITLSFLLNIPRAVERFSDSNFDIFFGAFDNMPPALSLLVVVAVILLLSWFASRAIISQLIIKPEVLKK